MARSLSFYYIAILLDWVCAKWRKQHPNSLSLCMQIGDNCMVWYNVKTKTQMEFFNLLWQMTYVNITNDKCEYHYKNTSDVSPICIMYEAKL